jgi:hypothetical protein
MMDTLDVRGVPDKYMPWLKRMVDDLKTQGKNQTERSENVVFATHKSHLVDGYSRAAAYEE